MILLTSALLIAAITPLIASVKAQAGQATVNVMVSNNLGAGGTTVPSGSGNVYNDGATVDFTANPNSNSSFLYWIVTTSQYSIELDTNPAPLVVSGGVTYTVEAFFTTLTAVPDQLMPPANSNAAIIVVLGGLGGTVSPAPGSYALANAAQTTLTATADPGWVFSHWIISGPPSTHGGVPYTLTPTNNPYTVGHGYGYTYDYQPVFVPASSSTTPTPTVNEFSSAAIIILALALVAVTFGTYAYTKKAKK